MAKIKLKFVCQDCGYESPKWLGHCPGCGNWNSMVEEQYTVGTEKRSGGLSAAAAAAAIPITAVDMADTPRLMTGINEFDRVLGGGVVPGALILIGGDPGIGKSTLLLQVAAGICGSHGPVLYVSGEESAAQTRLRAERLQALSDQMLLLTEINLAVVVAEAGKIKPALLIIDSIQTMFCPELPSAPGSVGQLRETTGQLLRFAKETGIPVAIIGHVTKEGTIAGPRLLEHMVDVVLYFEGERSYSFRVLRAIKNRFGPTCESGIFAMEEQGLVEVANPSLALLAERPPGLPGSVVLACLEGSRPLLLEIQALVSSTCFGLPRRMTAGFDYNRLNLLLAVLEKRVGLTLSNQDAYVNAVGGLRINEPAADLAVSLAIASSFRNVPIDGRTVVLGEVGLTGEVRMVPRAAVRIKEAAKLGFKRFVIPAGNLPELKDRHPDIEIIGVSHIAAAMEALLV